MDPTRCRRCGGDTDDYGMIGAEGPDGIMRYAPICQTCDMDARRRGTTGTIGDIFGR